MAKKLFITNERMLQLVQWAVQNNIASTDSEFFEMIGFTRNNIGMIKSGALSFTKEHILRACQITGASADWIYGFTNVMSRKKTSRPIDLLKEAVTAVETELKKRSSSLLL